MTKSGLRLGPKVFRKKNESSVHGRRYICMYKAAERLFFDRIRVRHDKNAFVVLLLLVLNSNGRFTINFPTESNEIRRSRKQMLSVRRARRTYSHTRVYRIIVYSFTTQHLMNHRLPFVKRTEGVGKIRRRRRAPAAAVKRAVLTPRPPPMRACVCVCVRSPAE